MDTSSGPPQVGVLLPTREQAITGAFAAAPLLDFARRAEQAGFDSLWAGDSLTARPRLDPLVVLSAAAAVTSRVTLGTAALTPALRHPLTGAHQVASLDHVAGARLALGLGSGFPMPETEEEFAAVGATFAGRAARLDEIVALWRQAWNAHPAEGDSDFEGRFWQAKGLQRLPAPQRPGGPPLWLAGSDTPRVLERVARHYDGWMPFLPSATGYAAAWRRIGELAAAAGRPAGAITPALYATITVNQDAAAARAELEHYIGHYYGRTLEQMAAVQAYAWGSAEQCAHALAAYVRSGARHLIIRIGSLESAGQLKQIADAVLPRLKEVSP
ncbi:LLM class flavin-dependent oxidoreductase [Streptomyces aurantiacus]|uniref:LLM class flavin-dependent oxidoreductase n=1 Tax=Streptomyces aurantiacus TaxID=47760 RepID=UPI0003FA407F|nr:LLM class flavin-dependent oxidoreductase [Streptomyces aurantiacus]